MAKSPQRTNAQSDHAIATAPVNINTYPNFTATAHKPRAMHKHQTLGEKKGEAKTAVMQYFKKYLLMTRGKSNSFNGPSLS